jgi:DNA-binding transcriptional LysR family regulator
MDLRQLRYFLALAEERNFSRASKRLHIAQPPLSRQIRGLEDELDTPLFVRTSKGVDLTAAGATLLDEASNLLSLARRARERTQAAGQGRIGRIDIGLFGSGVLDVIPRMLARFHMVQPEVKIVLHNMTKAEQLEALRERRISVGFNRLVPPEDDLSVEVMLRERVFVALPKGHALCNHSVIRIADLDDEPMILYPNVPMRGLAQEVANAFSREGVRLRVEQNVEDVVTSIALVASGFGFCVTTESSTHLRLPGVIYRPLSCRWLKDIELSCLWRRGDTAPVLTSFLSVVREFVRAHGKSVYSPVSNIGDRRVPEK